MPAMQKEILGAFKFCTAFDERLLGDYQLEHYSGKATRLILTDDRIVFSEQDEFGNYRNKEFSADCIIDVEWDYSYKPPLRQTGTVNRKKKNRALPIIGLLLMLGAAIFSLLMLDGLLGGVFEDPEVLSLVTLGATGAFGLLAFIFFIVALIPGKKIAATGAVTYLPLGNFAFDLIVYKLKGGELQKVRLTAGEFNPKPPEPVAVTKTPNASPPLPPPTNNCIKYTMASQKMIGEFGSHLQKLKKDCYQKMTTGQTHSVIYQGAAKVEGIEVAALPEAISQKIEINQKIKK